MTFRPITFSLLCIFTHTALANEISGSLQIQQQQNILEQQRQQQLNQQMQPNNHVQLPAPQPINSLKPSPTETSANDGVCFPIHEIHLVGEFANLFQFALKRALKESQFKTNKCLNANDINQIMIQTQNHIIGRGYTTTRVLAAPQNLKTGKLELTVLAGKIRHIKVNQQNESQTNSSRIAHFQNEFPINRHQILNLHDLEQGLENLKRLATAEADIQIVPSEIPNESNIVIDWKQRLVPYRLTFGLDNSGSKSTGKWQGSMTLSADNPLGLSDMAYVSFGRALGNTPDLKDISGSRIRGRTHNYALHYSVPFGKWLWSFNHSRYRYHQAVAGFQQNYDYNGDSSSQDFGVRRLMYRNASQKTHLGLKLWQRETRSYIDDAELTVQRRKTAGWKADLNHKIHVGRSTAQLNVAYQRGTGMRDALPAPEEAFNEGTSRMKIITADMDIQLPFKIKQQEFSYTNHVHAQWNKTPLTPQDKLAIGGRHTVRGFDGEMSLAAERGWYWRNELAWQYRPTHQIYVGADAGRVSGESAQYLLGQRLAGATAGVRGQFQAGGILSYDIFASRALKKPEFFKTQNTVVGLNVNYAF